MTKNKPFIDILVDLETLGISDTAPVIQVSAGAFHIGQHDVIATFNQKVDLKTFDKFPMEAGTLDFWTSKPEQVAQLRTYFSDTGLTEQAMWTKFADFLDKYSDFEVRLWGNGISFDVIKVNYNLKRFGLANPVEFWDERDVRTITQLAADKSNTTPQNWQKSVPNDNAHDALSDVIWEIEYVNRAYNLLIDRKHSK